jgi:N6-adenosine-specific RNA methylase IME4
MEVPLSEIQIGPRHRKAVTEIDRLAASIQEVGLLQPIVVTPEMRLVAGFRRIAAYRQLGRETIPAVVAANLDEALLLLKAERDENICRVEMTVEERLSMGEAIEPLERAAAAQRQEASTIAAGKASAAARLAASRRADLAQAVIDTGYAPPGSPFVVLPVNARKTFPNAKQDESKRALAIAAEAAGMTRPTYEKGQAVRAAAKADPVKFQPLVDEMNRTGKVDGVYKRLATIKAAEGIQAEPPPLPTGPFRVLVVDPPWRYDSRAEDPTHRAANPYPTMTVEELCKMPVAQLACDDAVLWLWVTNAFLPDVWRIVEAWGFKYKTMLTWAKDRMGTGDWLRGQTEHCLLCVRGKPTLTLTNQTTLLNGPLRAHSQKPDEFYAMVESLCPGSKVELFARQAREGWVSHGNECRAGELAAKAAKPEHDRAELAVAA